MLQETRASLRMLDSCTAELVAGVGVATVRFPSRLLTTSRPWERTLSPLLLGFFHFFKFCFCLKTFLVFSVGRGRQKLSYTMKPKAAPQQATTTSADIAINQSEFAHVTRKPPQKARENLHVQVAGFLVVFPFLFLRVLSPFC